MSRNWRPEPEDLRQILTFIKDQRTSSALFDVAIIGFGRLDRQTKVRKIAAHVEEGENAK